MLMARFIAEKAKPREDRLEGREIVMRSKKSFCKNNRAILRLKGAAVKPKTVSRRLSKEFELKSHTPAQKPHLTPVMKKKKKLDFVRRRRHWILVECRLTSL